MNRFENYGWRLLASAFVGLWIAQPRILGADVYLLNTSTDWNTAGDWSNGETPSAGNDYFVGSGYQLQVPGGSSSVTFGGGSLTLGDAANASTLFVHSTSYNQTVKINNLTLRNGMWNSYNGRTHTLTSDQDIHVAGSFTFQHRSGTSDPLGTRIDAVLAGAGDLTVSGRSESSASKNFVEFLKANTVSGSVRMINYVDFNIKHTNAVQNLTLNMQAGDTGRVNFSQNSTAGGLTGSRDIDFGGHTISVGNNNANGTYSGRISNGSLTKIGTGALTLAGANTYTGGTTINGGVLRMGAANALPTSRAVALADVSGAVLELNNYTQTIGSLAGGGSTGGNVSLGGATLTVNGSDSTTYAGAISGTGGLAKQGSGTLTLAGDNDYIGTTFVSRGVLRISHNNGLGQVSTNVYGYATDIAGGENTGRVELTGGITIPEHFYLLMRSGAAETVPHISSISGSNKLNRVLFGRAGGSYINIESAGTDPGDFLTLVSGYRFEHSGFTGTRRFRLMGAGDGEVIGDIQNGTADHVALIKDGPGTWTLTGKKSYTGTTTVNEGCLQVDGSITSSSQVLVNTGGTLGGTGAVGPVNLSGGTLSPGASIGTLAAGSTTWNDGSTFRFEIDDATGVVGASGGPGWDLLNVAGTLDLAPLNAGGFTIAVDTLATGGGTQPAPMANFNPSLGYSWEFVRTSGGIDGFEAADFLFDVGGFANPYDGAFSVTMQGNSLYVTYRPNTDPGASTVVASPTSVPANGTSASTITVTLKTAYGTGLAGRQVTLDFKAGSPGVAVIAPAGPVTTDANGVATFSVSSVTVGTEVFTTTDVTDGGGIVIAQTASVAFSVVSQTSLIAGYTPPAPPPPDAPQTSLAATTPPPNSPPAPDAQTAPDPSEGTDPEETVPGVIRVTEYYLTTGDFAGTAATLTLDGDLAADYFILVRGSRAGNGLSMPDSDYARVAAVPGGRGGLADSGAADRIGLRRTAAEFSWEGVVTVVECTAPDSPAGFRLVDAVVATLSGTSGSHPCAPWVDATRVVPFGGYRGGGVELTGGAANRYQGTSAYVRLSPSGTNTLDWQRDAGGETLVDAVMTTFVVEWGAGWTVQHAAVAGSNGGDGVDAPEEYTTAAIAPVARANTWVWGTGIRADAGIGDCAESCLVTLGDGVNLNAVEGTVAVGSEYTDAYSFDVYALTHPALAVDHRFKPDGDLKGLDIPVGVAPAAPGARFAWLYNGCNGTSSRFPRPRMWSRYTDDGTVTISRGYDGAEFPAWIQGIDFSGLKHGRTD